MVVSCVAPDCNERFRRNGPTFHRFPLTRKNLLQEWISAVNVEGFAPDKNSYICSKHFRSEDYKAGHDRNRLKPDAVPRLFSLSEMQDSAILIKKRAVKPKATMVLRNNKKLHFCIASIALDHSYSIGSIEKFEVEPPVIIQQTKRERMRGPRRRRLRQGQRVKDMVEDYYSSNGGPEGNQEILNPWQSRVIEACFLVPVICDLEEEDSPYEYGEILS